MDVFKESIAKLKEVSIADALGKTGDMEHAVPYIERAVSLYREGLLMLEDSLATGDYSEAVLSAISAKQAEITKRVAVLQPRLEEARAALAATASGAAGGDPFQEAVAIRAAYPGGPRGSQGSHRTSSGPLPGPGNPLRTH